MSIELIIPSNHLILCCPLLLLPSIFPASGSFPVIQLFIWGGRILELQIQHHPSNEYSGLISFGIDWFDLLPVQGTLKSLLQHHNSKASILGAQPSLWSNSHILTWLPCMTRWTFIGKVMSLIFNMLSRFVIAFLPRCKHLLMSWLQRLFAVILEPKKIKSVTVSIVYPSQT